LKFHPYPHPADVWLPNMVNAALYAIRKPGLAAARAAFPEEGIVDFAKDVFPWLLTQGAELRGYVSSEYIKDIGTPDRLDRACAALASGKVQRASLKHPQRAVFLDRDGTLNVPNGHIARPDALEVFDIAPEAVRVLNGTEYRVVMVTNQPVVARGDCTPEGLAHIHAKLETLLGRHGAYLERIYYCPHHPDKGFDGEVAALKIVCDCRKPQPGLLRRAAADLNIALSESWMIGDSAADIQAAAACGVTSVLVRTGEVEDTALLETQSDFAFDDVLRAARFIAINEPRIAAVVGSIAQDIGPGSDLVLTGQSKSGKSTLARTLARTLRRRGQPAVVVSLDRWMLADDDRSPGLLGRFDLAGALRTFRAARARAGGRVTLPALPVFSMKTRRSAPSPHDLAVEPETVIIWEGVLGLALAEAAVALDRCIFVETDEPERRNRIVAEYVARGRSQDDAQEVYLSRLEDEVATINAGRPHAARVVSLDACFDTGSST
jgi:D,D-heptose 1,7-bisphosphate phosphatase